MLKRAITPWYLFLFFGAWASLVPCSPEIDVRRQTRVRPQAEVYVPMTHVLHPPDWETQPERRSMQCCHMLPRSEGRLQAYCCCCCRFPAEAFLKMRAQQCSWHPPSWEGRTERPTASISEKGASASQRVVASGMASLLSVCCLDYGSRLVSRLLTFVLCASTYVLQSMLTTGVSASRSSVALLGHLIFSLGRSFFGRFVLVHRLFQDDTYCTTSSWRLTLSKTSFCGEVGPVATVYESRINMDSR